MLRQCRPQGSRVLLCRFFALINYPVASRQVNAKSPTLSLCAWWAKISAMCTDVYWCVLMCTDLYWYINAKSPAWCAKISAHVYWCVLMCTDVYRCVPMCTNVYRCIHSALMSIFRTSQNPGVVCHVKRQYVLKLSKGLGCKCEYQILQTGCIEI